VSISIIFSKSFTEPIRNLVSSAQRISEGNYKTSVQIDDFNGEFYILGSTFNDMANKIYDYSENLEQMVKIRTKEINDANEKMKRELAMAQNIQQAIIPKVFPKVGALQIYGFYQPMDDLGGDFYDVFMLDKNRIVFVIVDVCGHGVPAALITTMAKVSFFNNSRENLKTSEILTLVNEEICGAIGENNSYFTAFYGIFDIKSKILEYTNAGHNEITILKNDKSIVLLDSNSGFVGMIKGLEYKTDYITLDAGDKLILYTDGIPEARNAAKELYGFDRFKDSIIKHSDLSLEEMIKSIIDDAKEFRGDFRVDDDMTILVVQILPDSIEININLSDIANKIKIEINNSAEDEFAKRKNQILTAINCFNESLYDKSIEILKEVDKYFNRKKDKFDIFYLLGCNYYKNSDFKSALKYFEKANTINSEDKNIKQLINILKSN
jgi:sigma-B regulation protein RsbU (phosphoserine phosphatase)